MWMGLSRKAGAGGCVPPVGRCSSCGVPLAGHVLQKPKVMLSGAAPPLDRSEFGDVSRDQLRMVQALPLVLGLALLSRPLCFSWKARCVAHATGSDLARKVLVSLWIIRVPRLTLTKAL